MQQQQQDTAARHTCSICFEDDLPADEMGSMECGHAFCRTCWRGVIATTLRQGLPDAALRTTCPHAGCPLTVTEELIQRTAPDLLPQFDLRQTESFVRTNARTLRFCPGPECGRVAVKPHQQFFEDDGCNYRCSNCDTHFCFQCGAKPHQGGCLPDVGIDLLNPPAAAAGLPGHRAAALRAAGRAAMMDDFGDPIDDLEGRQLRDSSHDRKMKPCPKCSVLIQKMGGCNRMNCKCRHAFCWLCLGDYPSYGGHFCGKKVRREDRNFPHVAIDRVHVNLNYLRDTLAAGGGEGADVPDGSDALLRQLCELERYAHYYNRYAAHGQGQHFAEQQCLCLEHRANNYTELAGFRSGTEVDFIATANETLVAARRLLKYTYCAAYHLDEDEDSHLGYVQLERLERFTEELSEISENAVTRQDRTRVLELTHVVSKCCEAVTEFELQAALSRR
jgi:hypothetical protein